MFDLVLILIVVIPSTANIDIALVDCIVLVAIAVNLMVVVTATIAIVVISRRPRDQATVACTSLLKTDEAPRLDRASLATSSQAARATWGGVPL